MAEWSIVIVIHSCQLMCVRAGGYLPAGLLLRLHRCAPPYPEQPAPCCAAGNRKTPGSSLCEGEGWGEDVRSRSTGRIIWHTSKQYEGAVLPTGGRYGSRAA